MKMKRTLLVCMVLTACALCGCAGNSSAQDTAGVSGGGASGAAQGQPEASGSEGEPQANSRESIQTSWTDLPEPSSDSGQADASKEADSADEVQRFWKKLDVTKDFRDEFAHGKKPAKYQKYIMLHDTEGEGDAASVVEYWDSSDAYVAAHFVVNKDGTIVQCVPLDQIAHHAGFGDTGHNELYDVSDESRDDRRGTTEIGDWAADYGMNSYSVGIEMVHVGGEGEYPEEQLQAVDDLIAYIDAYFGGESQIIDHKAWRTGNSDTSEEFATYLANYQDHRTHAQ